MEFNITLKRNMCYRPCRIEDSARHRKTESFAMRCTPLDSRNAESPLHPALQGASPGATLDNEPPAYGRAEVTAYG